MDIMGFEFPGDRLYDREHVWFKQEGDNLRIGVTDFFQKTANEIVFVELPAAGRTLETGKPFLSVESGKWVGRVKCTVSGDVAEANAELKDFPYLINESPYDEGWVIDITPSDPDHASGLLDLNDPGQLSEYEEFLRVEKRRAAESAG